MGSFAARALSSWGGFFVPASWVRWFFAYASGVVLVFVAVVVFGKALVIRGFLHMGLRQSDRWEKDELLSATDDLGGPSTAMLARLMESDDPGVRAIGAGTFNQGLPNSWDALPVVRRFYNDSQAVVRLMCLEAGSDRGDRRALLLVYSTLREADTSSREYGLALNFLAFRGFREAGDHIVSRLPSSGGNYQLRLLYELERMLHRGRYLGVHGVFFEGRFVTSSSDGLTAAGAAGLSKGLTEIWHAVRSSYHSIDQVRDGDTLKYPTYGEPGPGTYYYGLLHWSSQAVWALAFWGIVLVKWKRRRTDYSARQPGGSPIPNGSEKGAHTEPPQGN